MILSYVVDFDSGCYKILITVSFIFVLLLMGRRVIVVIRVKLSVITLSQVSHSASLQFSNHCQAAIAALNLLPNVAKLN